MKPAKKIGTNLSSGTPSPLPRENFKIILNPYKIPYRKKQLTPDISAYMQPFKKPVLRTRKGDLTKEWYVEYKFYNNVKRQWDRFKIMEGINRYHTKQERKDYGAMLVEAMNDLLIKGFNPFKRFQPGDEVIMPTVAQAVAQFIKHKSIGYRKNGKGLSDRTVQTYRAASNSFLDYLTRFHLQEEDITAITGDHVRNYLDEKLEAGAWNNTTRNNHLRDISIMFTFFKRKKWISENIAAGIDQKPQEYGTRNTPPTPDQFEKIFNHLYDHDKELCLYASIIYYTAWRTSAVGSIRIKDIMMNDPLPKIILNSDSDKENEKRVRNIPAPLLALFLHLHINELHPEWFLFSNNFKPGPAKIKTIRNRVDDRWRLVIKKGLGMNVDLYSLKHKILSDLVETGEDFKKIMDFSGHKDFKSFFRYIRSVTTLNNESFLKNFKPLPFQK